MNSLNDLNSWSNVSISYQDLRAPLVTFIAEPVNQSASTYVTKPFIAPIGVDIKSISNVISEDIRFAVNVALTPTANVYWPALAPGLTSNSVGNVYTVYGINNITEWKTARQPIITVPDGTQNFTYTSSVLYEGSNSKSFTTAVTVDTLNQFTAASDFYYPANTNKNLITGHPTVTALEDFPTDSYSLTVTANDNRVFGNLTIDNAFTSNATFTSNTFSVAGNLSVINNHLNALKYQAPGNIDFDWIATYTLQNPVSGYTSVRTQDIRSLSSLILESGVSDVYVKNTFRNVSGSPTIKANAFVGNTQAVFRLDISPTNYVSTPSSMISNITSSIGVAWGNLTANTTAGVYWDNTNKIFTAKNTKDNLNNLLGNVQIQPGIDFEDTIYLNYQVICPTTGDEFNPNPAGNLAVKVQALLKTDTDPAAISNINNTRYFQKNSPDYLFTVSVPQILETVSEWSYTVYFSSPAGRFGLTDTSTSATFSYTGNYTQINAMLPTLRFYPYKDVTGTQQFNYKQYKNGLLQFESNVPLIGSGDTVITGNVVEVLTNSGTYSPTFQNAFYRTAKIAAIGGGGLPLTIGRGFNSNGQYVTDSIRGGGGGMAVLEDIRLGYNTTFKNGGAIPITIGDWASGFAKSTIFGNLVASTGAKAFITEVNNGPPITQTYVSINTPPQGGAYATGGNARVGANPPFKSGGNAATATYTISYVGPLATPVYTIPVIVPAEDGNLIPFGTNANVKFGAGGGITFIAGNINTQYQSNDGNTATAYGSAGITSNFPPGTNRGAVIILYYV